MYLLPTVCNFIGGRRTSTGEVFRQSAENMTATDRVCHVVILPGEKGGSGGHEFQECDARILTAAPEGFRPSDTEAQAISIVCQAGNPPHLDFFNAAIPAIPDRMAAVVLPVKEACVSPCLLAGNSKRLDASPKSFKHILFQYGCVYDIVGKRVVDIPEGTVAHGTWPVGCLLGHMEPADGAEI